MARSHDGGNVEVARTKRGGGRNCNRGEVGQGGVGCTVYGLYDLAPLFYFANASVEGQDVSKRRKF